MNRTRFPVTRSIVLALATIAVGRIAEAQDNTDSRRAAQTQALATWNIIALQTTAAAPINPPREARALAMVSAAVFDAVNSITQEHAPYVLKVPAGRGASIEAAVTAAAHGVLTALYPSAAKSLDSARDSALSRLAAGREKDDGIAAGKTVAAAIVSARARDRASDVTQYTPRSSKGIWVPTAPGFVAAMEPGWGRLAPFFLDSGSQFRPAPPPALGSDAYVRDYIEVMDIGASKSVARSKVQAEVGQFWVLPAAHIWNQLVRQLAVTRKLDPASAARAYLLLNLAGADALVAAWEAKFHYNQWRPITAIRSVADDGSSATGTDTTWSPMITTPPFPDYPAGHTSYAGAAERVLGAIFGTKPGNLSLTSSTAAGATHRYAGFEEIADEVVNARVWAGVHWRTSCTAGRTLGHSVAELALARAPKRLN